MKTVGMIFFFVGAFVWFLSAVIVTCFAEPGTFRIFNLDFETGFKLYSLAPMIIGIGIHVIWFKKE